ncbi:DUF4198 domain-containing protein [Telmatocola sphagniphila]|uniref:DUF4198 domain-containing protein n=1 Tax=Telmatocola sphagniphila TaxID=1123043 RepID=A0A8E6ET10_9BACT|nr:DUF4198 domain-containing protein [Telmatocola sphagniphila]QVL31759.1 DUF4198 domain-containing protein [Telmatocola sphagniphila]
MKRIICSMLLFACMAFVAEAHFVYIVPDKDGTSAQIILSETLEADEDVGIAKLANMKLIFIDATGKEVSLKHETGKHALTVKVPSRGVIFGSVDYGVMAKGEGTPYLLRYHAKAILVDAQAKIATLGEKQALEICVVGEPGKNRFQVFSSGKPVAEAEVTVLKPDGNKEKLKTDKDGYTPSLTGSGRFGAWTKKVETQSGDLESKAYSEIRNYASIVVDLNPAK